MLGFGALNGVNSVVAVSEGSRVLPGHASAVSALLMGLPWCVAALGPVVAGLLADPARGGTPSAALGWFALLLPLAVAASLFVVSAPPGRRARARRRPSPAQSASCDDSARPASTAAGSASRSAAACCSGLPGRAGEQREHVAAARQPERGRHRRSGAAAHRLRLAARRLAVLQRDVAVAVDDRVHVRRVGRRARRAA